VKRQILVLTEKTEGGEWIAITRLLTAFKETYPSVSYRFVTLTTRKYVRRKLGFIRDLVNYFKYARLKIKTSVESQKVDTILVSDYLWALAALSVKPKNTRLFFLFHGLRSVVFKKLTDIDYKQLLTKFFERLAWLLSDAIIVPSVEAGNYVLTNLFFKNKIKLFIVPNIVPKAFFKVTSNTKKKRCYTVMYSGRMDKYKGLENLIPAFSRVVLDIPKAKLIMACPLSSVNGDEERLVKSLINKHHLETRVRIIKGLTIKQLATFYHKASVLVLPSEIEFAPLSVLESLASGTSVIGTNVGNVGGLLNKLDSNLILTTNSPEMIYKKLMLFHSYSETKKRILGAKAITLAGKFSEKRAVRSFKKVFDS